MIEFLGATVMSGKAGSAALSAALSMTFGGAGAGGDAAERRLPDPAGFSATYGCAVPVLGPRSVTVGGVLTLAPARPVAGAVTRVRLHITGMNLRSPVTIDSWRATADIDVTGVHTASFRLRGSGGRVPAHRPVVGDLSGAWSPRVPGTVRLRAGAVTLNVHVAVVGDVTVACAPNRPRPVIAEAAVMARGRDARATVASARSRDAGPRPLTGLLPWPRHAR